VIEKIAIVFGAKTQKNIKLGLLGFLGF